SLRRGHDRLSWRPRQTRRRTARLARGSHRTAHASARGRVQPGRRPGSSARPAPTMTRSCRHRRSPHGWGPCRSFLSVYSWPPQGLLRRGDFGGLAGTLICDELLQPADFALTGLQAVARQLEGVRVEALGGAAEHLPQPFPTLLDLAAAPLQDAQPGGPVGAGEEREVHAEPGVLPGLWPGPGQHLPEALFAVR